MLFINNQKGLKMKKRNVQNSRLLWSSEEQNYLKHLRQVQNQKSWKHIASLINSYFPDKNRNGKQCRERYLNYVKFSPQKPKIQSWSEEDDLNLFEKFVYLGPKWVQISKLMPGRSENGLKNRFYGILRKLIRKIDKVEKQEKIKYKKSIKYDSLLRILSYKKVQEQITSTWQVDRKEFIRQLKKDLINLAVIQQEYTSTKKVLSLIVRIHEFNCLKRRTGHVQKFNSQLHMEKSQINSNIKFETPLQEMEITSNQSNMEDQLSAQKQAISFLQDLTEEKPNQIMDFFNQKYVNNEKTQTSLEELMFQICQQRYTPIDIFFF